MGFCIGCGGRKRGIDGAIGVPAFCSKCVDQKIKDAKARGEAFSYDSIL